MDFNEFWDTLSVEPEREKEFRTLKRSKACKARITDSDVVTVTPGSRDEREIPKDQFREMWDIMKDDVRNERYVNTNKRYYKFWSSSYVSALIDHVVGNQSMQ